MTGGRASPPTAGLIFAARGLEGTVLAIIGNWVLLRLAMASWITRYSDDDGAIAVHPSKAKRGRGGHV